MVTANVKFHPAPLEDDQPIFVGSAEPIEADIVSTRRLGTEELIFNGLFSPSIGSTADLLSRLEQLQTVARRSE